MKKERNGTMLEVKDATIAIGGRELVRGLSFIAKDGELTCITGQERVGKTTLLRTLMGFLPVSEGFVSVDGELLTVQSAPAFRRLMVYLPQASQTLRHQLNEPEAPSCAAEDYAVWEPLMPEAVAVGQPSPLTAEELFRLESDTLAGAHDKTIVVADEPAACLTSALTLRLIDLLREQAKAGRTVLIASRNPTLVAHADQVVHIGENRLI